MPRFKEIDVDGKRWLLDLVKVVAPHGWLDSEGDILLRRAIESRFEMASDYEGLLADALSERKVRQHAEVAAQVGRSLRERCEPGRCIGLDRWRELFDQIHLELGFPMETKPGLVGVFRNARIELAIEICGETRASASEPVPAPEAALPFGAPITPSRGEELWKIVVYTGGVFLALAFVLVVASFVLRNSRSSGKTPSVVLVPPCETLCAAEIQRRIERLTGIADARSSREAGALLADLGAACSDFLSLSRAEKQMAMEMFPGWKPCAAAVIPSTCRERNREDRDCPEMESCLRFVPDDIELNAALEKCRLIEKASEEN